MSEFIKKALGLFVEFEESAPPAAGENNGSSPARQHTPQPSDYRGQMSSQDIEKFTKHFNDVFDGANLPGPDYFEFSKMMDMLETAIPDENNRIMAVYASLSLQGLTKAKVIDSARQYVVMLEQDKARFDKAASEKANVEIEDRRTKIGGLEKKIADNAEMIKKLNQEITDAQAAIGNLKNEIVQLDTKISASKGGYIVAFQAMYNKIAGDIQKLNSLLK